MRVKILAAESMGVRSMATFIETSDARIIIDPSCALCPRRFGLPPHPLEISEKAKRLKNINSHLKIADIVIITHYHYDHFTNENAQLYENKLLFAKDPVQFSHEGLKKRAEKFFRLLPESTRVEIADSVQYKARGTEIIFSDPMPHGKEGAKVYVLSVCIKSENTVFLHSSDIQGINTENQLSFIKACSPDILFLDGFPAYLINQHYTLWDFNNSLRLLKKAANYTKILIIDHHLTRINNFRELIPRSIDFVTAASFMQENESLFEARRIELYSL